MAVSEKSEQIVRPLLLYGPVLNCQDNCSGLDNCSPFACIDERAPRIGIWDEWAGDE